MPPRNEVWKDVVGFEGRYQISNKGRVRSLDMDVYNGKVFYRRKGKIMAPSKARGVPGIRFGLNGPRFLIGRMVLTAFVGPCPPGMECCHFPDRDPANNNVENLRWDTHQGNMQDKKFHGTDYTGDKRGEANGAAKLNNKKVMEIRSLHAQGQTQASLAKEYGVKPCTVMSIVNWHSWSHLPKQSTSIEEQATDGE